MSTVEDRAHQRQGLVERAGRKRHSDEEQDLFPLLRPDRALSGLLDRLEHEHAQMGALWRELELLLVTPDTIRDLPAFAQWVQAFNELYARHIESENRELLPRAVQLLSAETLRQLGARMAARRGVIL